MLASKKNVGEIRPKRRALLTVQILLVAITGLLAVRIWSIDGGQAWKLFAGLCACSTASLIFRMGWLVPCIVIGTFAGTLLDAKVKGGTIESQMWETVWSICSGAVVGCVIGLIVDSPRRVPQNDNEDNTAE